MEHDSPHPPRMSGDSPAFPHCPASHGHAEEALGLTKRELFALGALVGLISSVDREDVHTWMTTMPIEERMKLFATHAVEQADALLAALGSR